MKRVLILGPGGAGKTTLALRLGELTSLPVVELDKEFWGPTLIPLPPADWAELQDALVEKAEWIMDGDLGPYDDLAPRLSAADTVLVLALPRWRCGWRAMRRSRERKDFWRWLWHWKKESLPALVEAVGRHGTQAEVVWLTTPGQVEKWVLGVAETVVDPRRP